MREKPYLFSSKTASEPPTTLFHYTSLDSMQKIIESESIFASDALYLNDQQELIQTRSVLSHRIEYLLEHESADLRPGLHFLKKFLKPEPISPVYVASFSEKHDDLSQWRGYTPPGAGICIGFDSDSLKEELRQLSFENGVQLRSALLDKVTYLGADSGDIFDDLLLMACAHMDIIDGAVLRAVTATKVFDVAIPFYKNISFEDEAEWRICLTAFDHLDVRFPMSFRIGASMLIPFSRVTFTGKKDKMIRSLTIGPGSKSNLTLRAVERFAEAHGLSSRQIAVSEVPYRSW